MRFLVDQDVYFITVQLLREWGHDVLIAKEMGMQEATDLKILEKASQTNRILVSRDKGFGSLVFLGSFPSAGVILLRIDPVTVEQVHRELERLLMSYPEDELQSLFSVVEAHRYRLRHLK